MTMITTIHEMRYPTPALAIKLLRKRYFIIFNLTGIVLEIDLKLKVGYLLDWMIQLLILMISDWILYNVHAFVYRSLPIWLPRIK